MMFLMYLMRRSHALAEAGCILSLKNIAEGASLATKERIAPTFRRLGTEPMHKDLIVQQRGLVSFPQPLPYEVTTVTTVYPLPYEVTIITTVHPLLYEV